MGEREDIPQIMARADVVLAARCDHIPWAQRSPDDPKPLRPVSSAHRPGAPHRSATERVELNKAHRREKLRKQGLSEMTTLTTNRRIVLARRTADEHGAGAAIRLAGGHGGARPQSALREYGRLRGGEHLLR